MNSESAKEMGEGVAAATCARPKISCSPFSAPAQPRGAAVPPPTLRSSRLQCRGYAAWPGHLGPWGRCGGVMAPSSSIPHQARTRTAPLPISLLFAAPTRYRLLPPRMAPASSPGLPRSHHPLRACPLPPRPPPHVYRPHGPGGDGRDPLQLRRRPSPASARPAGGPALRSATYPPSRGGRRRLWRAGPRSRSSTKMVLQISLHLGGHPMHCLQYVEESTYPGKNQQRVPELESKPRWEICAGIDNVKCKKGNKHLFPSC
ncbi:uncharacterized protein PRD47_007879 [Ara ararauna]